MTYNFNEKTKENDMPVWQSPKYLDSKKRVIEMLDSGKFKGLNEGHFWILMNKTKNNQMAYTGLIISHDGMKIINDNQPDNKKAKPSCFSKPITSEYQTNEMYMTYCDEETYEVGEVNKDNCKNAYPYAMLFKRTFDRVVKDKAQLYGVYSEEEAEEFKRNIEEPTQQKTPASKKQIDYIKKLYKPETLPNMLAHYNLNSFEEMTAELASSIISKANEKIEQRKQERWEGLDEVNH